MADLKINNLDAIAAPLQDDDLLLVKMKRRANALADEDRQASWAVVRSSLNLNQYMPTVGGTFTGTVTLANNVGLNSRATNGTARRLLQFGSNNRLSLGETAIGLDIYAGDFPRFTKDGTNFYNVITTNNLPTPASLSDGGAYTKAQVDAIALTKASLTGAQFTGHVILNPEIPLRSFNAQGTSVNLITYEALNGVTVGSHLAQTFIASGLVPLWYNGSTSYKVYTEGSKPSAAELGFYSSAQIDGKFDQKANLSGAKFTGHVTVNKDVQILSLEGSTPINLAVYQSNGITIADSTKQTYLASNLVPFWHNGTNSHKIYTEGNKPTTAELGLTDTVSKASTALQQGAYGLGGVPQFLSDTGFLAVSNQTQFFSQNGSSDQQRFGGRGNGVHIYYGLTTDQTQSLSSSLFVRDNAKVIAKWSTSNASNGAPIQTLTNELYGTLNKPTAADVGAYSKTEADQTFAKQSGTGNPIPAGANLAFYDASKAGVWYQDVPANATLALGYPVANVAGVLDVSPIQGNGSCYQEYKTLNSTVKWVRFINTSDTSPWRAISTDTDTRYEAIKVQRDGVGLSLRAASNTGSSYIEGLDASSSTLKWAIGMDAIGGNDQISFTASGKGYLLFPSPLNTVDASVWNTSVGNQVSLRRNGDVAYGAAVGAYHDFNSALIVHANGEAILTQPYSDSEPCFVAGRNAAANQYTWRIGKFGAGTDIQFVNTTAGSGIGLSSNGNIYHDAPNHLHIFGQGISTPTVDTNALSVHKVNGGELITLKPDSSSGGAWIQVRDVNGLADCSLGMRPNENTAEFYNGKTLTYLRLMDNSEVRLGSAAGDNLTVYANGGISARGRVFAGGGSASLGTDGNVGGTVWGSAGTAKGYIDSAPVNTSKSYTDQKLAAQNSSPLRKIWGRETGSYPQHFDAGFLPLPPDASHAVAANTTFGSGRSIRLDEPLWGKKLWSTHGDSYSGSVPDPRGFIRAWHCEIPNMSDVTSIDDQGNVRPFTDFEIQIGSRSWRFRMSTDGRTISYIVSSGDTSPIYSIYVQDNV
ncbi:hypothetical protein Arno18_100 [Pectobacterium phage Arno18]|uniref:Tail fiber protein n=1 Tax=Pectobacterium phage Arno18 TaxID=2500578 RepID=A0A678ZZK1_9CAUD|nr:hypothetical protein Arno18_100 [Pectobacterium phage Arno18]